MTRYLAPGIAALLLLSTPAWAADGCPTGSYSIGTAPDGLSRSVLFTDFVVDAGGTGPATATSECAVDVFPADPSGYSVYSADYRGFAMLDTGQSATFTAFGPDGRPVTRTVAGAYGDVFDASQLVGTTPGEVLSLNAALTVSAGTGPDAEATLDSADFARIGFTTWDSVKASIDQLAAQRLDAIRFVSATSELLLGGLQPLDGPSGVRTIVATGSGLMGLSGRADLGGGLSLLGGAGLFSGRLDGLSFGPSFLVAGALRYVIPSSGPLQVYVEGGAHLAPGLHLDASRTAMNGDTDTLAHGNTTALAAGAYARLGALYALSAADDLAIAATLSHDAIAVRGYSEPMSPANLFPASVAGTTSSENAVTASVQWTHRFSPAFGATILGAVGRTFGGHDQVQADVAWVGPVVGESTGDVTTVEFGASLDWHPTDRLSIDAFALVNNAIGAGSSRQIGASLALSF